jgi:Zn-dependent peptidase ImmA (M78 family)
MFTPSRLTLARQRRGLTKVKLAQACGLDVQTLSRYEAGRMEPTDDSISRLGLALDFPVDFFIAEEVEALSPLSASFRAMKSMTARQRDAALSAGCLAIEFNDWVQKKFKLQQPDVPDGDGLSPEVAAEATRAQWKLGDRPLGNIVHQLELHGVRVFSLAQDCREVNAFSLWREGTPFVFLNTMKTPERGRFDAAHELGHLVMHREGDKGRDVEQEANQFASAFLMPRGSIAASAPRSASLPDLTKAKRIWNVSLAALVHRMHELKLLSDWHHRTLFITLSELGYRSAEPNGLAQRETSQVWTKVFSALRQDGVTKGDVARALRIPPKELDSLVFGLVQMGSIEGGSTQGTSVAKGKLRIV